MYHDFHLFLVAEKLWTAKLHSRYFNESEVSVKNFGKVGVGHFTFYVATLVLAIPAAYLLCSTAIRRGIRATWCFCSCKLTCRNVDYVLPHCFNAQPTGVRRECNRTPSVLIW